MVNIIKKTSLAIGVTILVIFTGTIASANEKKIQRQGTLKVEVHLTQHLDKKIIEKNTNYHQYSKYNLTASLTQKVNIVDDFRYFTKIPGKTNSQERLDFFKQEPYWKIEGFKPKMSGKLNYEGSFTTISPKDISIIFSEVKNKGHAQLEWIKLKHLRPSISGEGLEFKLKWYFEGTEETNKTFKHKNDSITKDDKQKPNKKHSNKGWSFYPTLSTKRISQYPYEFEYKTHPSASTAMQKKDKILAANFQKLLDRGFDINHFFGTITKAEKDKMTIYFNSKMRKTNANHLFPIPIKPNKKNTLKVKITIQAD